MSFGVTLRTIQNWCNDNLLPYCITPGRHRRIRLSSVLALQAAQAAAAGTLPMPGPQLPFVDVLVEKEVKRITDYLDHLADQPSAQPNKCFWLREISAMIRNGEHKRAV